MDRLRLFAEVAALVALMALAASVRLVGLAASDGRLNIDEARTVVAADGVLQSGVPLLPSGRIYTRGMLNSYLVAPSFAVLGRHDFAARLPSAIAGVLLGPAVFLLGRALGGSAAALAAAGFVALADPLVHYSRLAWVPSVFLLMFVLAGYAWYRGFVEDRGGWQVVGALGFVLALLSYEFAMFLPAGLALYLGINLALGQRTWYRGRWTLLAFGLTTVGILLFGALTVALRIGTLAGPLGEANYWLAPRLSWRGPSYYLRQYEEYQILLGAALLGLPLLVRWRTRGTVYAGVLLLIALAVPCFILRDRLTRYVLPALPLLAVVVAAGTVRLATVYGASVGLTDQLRRALPGLALLAIFGLALQQDLDAAVQRLQRPPPGPTWVEALRQEGIQPTDLILGEGVTKIHFYFGRAEYYLRIDDYERYAYGPPDALRYIYSDSTLVTSRGDFERLVEEPNHGRTLWLVGTRGKLEDRADEIDPTLWPSLVASADRRVRTPDGWELLRVTLPRRGSAEGQASAAS